MCYAGSCPKPKNKTNTCFVCKKDDQLAAKCPNKRNERGRDVKRINETSEEAKQRDDYEKEVEIDGQKVRAFVDLGSKVMTLKKNRVTAAVGEPE